VPRAAFVDPDELFGALFFETEEESYFPFERESLRDQGETIRCHQRAGTAALGVLHNGRCESHMVTASVAKKSSAISISSLGWTAA
jgi:hypothetical protein